MIINEAICSTSLHDHTRRASSHHSTIHTGTAAVAFETDKSMAIASRLSAISGPVHTTEEQVSTD
jgi:hypothetical protein